MSMLSAEFSSEAFFPSDFLLFSFFLRPPFACLLLAKGLEEVRSADILKAEKSGEREGKAEKGHYKPNRNKNCCNCAFLAFHRCTFANENGKPLSETFGAADGLSGQETDPKKDLNIHVRKKEKKIRSKEKGFGGIPFFSDKTVIYTSGSS